MPVEFACRPVAGTEAAPLPALSESSGSARRVWSRRVAADLAGAADALAVMAAAVATNLILTATETGARTWAEVGHVTMLALIVLFGCFRSWNRYDPLSFHALPARPLQASSAAALASAAASALATPPGSIAAPAWAWAGLWALLGFALLLATRIAIGSILGRLTAAGYFDTRIAVFGAGAIARRVHDLLADPALGIRFAGLYEDRGPDRINTAGLATAGRLDDLIEAAREDALDRIIIALPASAGQRIGQIVRRLEPLPVSVHVVTHIAGDLVEIGRGHEVSALGPIGLVEAKRRALAGWAPLVKQAEDYLLASLALAVLAPLLALIAIAIKLDSRGPVLFRQRRRGLNHAIIEVLKFRTMTVMEDGGELRQATRADPRVTRIGSILRRTSLDELPQLVNVIRGEMSLVGPRPHALFHDARWGDMVERYANRNQVKPGITGLAQVNGWRGEVTASESIRARIQHDLDYIARWSLWLDMKILARTVGTIIGGKNAY